jgi:hypothetical protein
MKGYNQHQKGLQMTPLKGHRDLLVWHLIYQQLSEKLWAAEVMEEEKERVIAKWKWRFSLVYISNSFAVTSRNSFSY